MIPVSAGLSRSAKTGPVRSTWLQLASVFVLFLGIIILIQHLSGAWASETSHYPDEPSHVVTSLMIHDYIASGFPASPMNYGESYYIHYPKVAFGMWPPVFHICAAAWMLLFGASKAALLFFVAAQGAGLATTLYWFCRAEFGFVAALGLGVLLLLNPLTESTFTMIMLDVSISLLDFLSMVALLRFFRTQQTRDAALFGLITAIAMLTKGNSNALVLMPPVVMLLTRSWSILKKPGIYIGACIIALVGGPWQILSWSLLKGSVPIAHIDASWIAGNFRDYAKDLLDSLGWTTIALAIVGLFLAVRRARAISSPADRTAFTLAGAVALFFAVVVFQCIAPVPPDIRYVAPVVPPLLIFFAYGVLTIARQIPTRFPLAVSTTGLAVLCLAPFAMNTFAIPSRPPLGFARVADVLMAADVPPNSVSLVCADSLGEGALIAEIALRDRHARHFLLRSSKVMSENEWDPTIYRPQFQTPVAVLDYLDSVPVHFVVVDHTKPLWKADRNLLLSAIQNNPKWQIIKDIPESPVSRHLVVYRRTDMPGTAASGRPNIQINMRFTLGRNLKLK